MGVYVKICGRFGVPALLVALAWLTGAPALVHADYEFTYSSGSNNLNSTVGPVNVQAVFTVTNNQITISLTNLESGIGSVGGAISGISFTVSPDATSGPTLTSVTGDVVDYASSPSNQGRITYSGSTLSDSHWGTNAQGLDVFVGSQPDHLILGPSANLNSGSTQQHEPYFVTTSASDSVVFVMSAGGVTSASAISDVVVTWGTSGGEGSHELSLTVSTPAPTSGALAAVGAIGLIGFAGFARRRRVARAA